MEEDLAIYPEHIITLTKSPRHFGRMNDPTSSVSISGMNRKGIGICLVGNFNKEQVTKKQMDSLVYLVNMLRKYFNIPAKNILGHGHVSGAKMECPGKYFPCGKFKDRLKNSN